jgi:hypothetical protein
VACLLQYLSQRTAGIREGTLEWDLIMMHMRSLENMTPENAKAILEYLKTR